MNQVFLIFIHFKLLFMKKMTHLKSTLIVCFILMSLSFSSKNSSSKNFCGPIFFASDYGYPEMNNVKIDDGSYSETYYVCCGNDGYLDQWSSLGFYTISVYVESDWSGGVDRYVGVRYYGGNTIQCQQYSYGQGLYVFTIPSAGCSAYEVFVGASC